MKKYKYLLLLPIIYFSINAINVYAGSCYGRVCEYTGTLTSLSGNSSINYSGTLWNEIASADVNLLVDAINLTDDPVSLYKPFHLFNKNWYKRWPQLNSATPLTAVAGLRSERYNGPNPNIILTGDVLEGFELSTMGLYTGSAFPTPFVASTTYTYGYSLPQPPLIRPTYTGVESGSIEKPMGDIGDLNLGGTIKYANRYSHIIPRATNETESSIVTSSDSSVIECVSKVCTAKKPGTAKITVSFPNKNLTSSKPFAFKMPSEQTTWIYRNEIFSYPAGNVGYGYLETLYRSFSRPYYERIPLYSDEREIFQPGSNFEYTWKYVVDGFWPAKDDEGILSFSVSNLTYNIKVEDELNSQVVACEGIDTITENSANIKWTYSDSDPQSNYQIQVATDNSFNNIVSAVTAPPNTDVSNIRNDVVSGLITNTTYYARVRADNENDDWSEYSSCGSFSPVVASDSSLYCSANPLQVVSGQNTTFTAYPSGGTYKWDNNSSLTQNPYTTQLGLGKNIMNVEIQKNGVTETTSCIARVCNGSRPEDEVCASGQDTYKKYSTRNTCDDNGEWLYTDESCSGGDNGGGDDDEGGSQINASFYFSPAIADQTNNCQIILEANNVSSCHLKNRLLSTVKTWSTASGNINIPGEQIGVGTYQLYCTGTALGAISEKIGSAKSCSSNPDIREN